MSRFGDSGNDDSSETAIDISPLIDCVFILLIFFIVTTVFVEESGIEVDKPEAAAAVPQDKQSVQIAVSAKGRVFAGGREIGVKGVQAHVKRMLSEGLVPVIIQGDENAPHGVVAKVVGEAKDAGAEKVSLSIDNG